MQKHEGLSWVLLNIFLYGRGVLCLAGVSHTMSFCYKTRQCSRYPFNLFIMPFITSLNSHILHLSNIKINIYNNRQYFFYWTKLLFNLFSYGYDFIRCIYLLPSAWTWLNLSSWLSFIAARIIYTKKPQIELLLFQLKISFYDNLWRLLCTYCTLFIQRLTRA